MARRLHLPGRCSKPVRETKMTREHTGKYRQQLEAMAARIGGTVAGLEEQVRLPTGGQAAGGLSNTPLHLGDIGTDVYNQELGTTLLENETYIRNEILSALERITHGTFGRCENCGRDIAPERLDALPYTRYCTACAAKVQAGLAVNLNEGRPDSWLGAPGHEMANEAALPGGEIGGLESKPGDIHAVGTPGGGTAVGGLAGTTVGEGDPSEAPLEEAMGSSEFDVEADSGDGDETETQAFSGHAGGAVGGTPANKRSRGGKTSDRAKPSGKTPTPKSQKKPAGKTTKKNNRGKRQSG